MHRKPGPILIKIKNSDEFCLNLTLLIRRADDDNAIVRVKIGQWDGLSASANERTPGDKNRFFNIIVAFRNDRAPVNFND